METMELASDLEFVQFVADQIDSDKEISYRKMFGEYALYCNKKIVGLICDNRFFVKITEAGREFAGKISQGSPYPGAKAAFLIEDQIDDREWVSKLIEITEKELPVPKPKKKKKKK